MWLLVAREPVPDAAYWPGRQVLAAVDAVGWPLLWVLVLQQAPGPGGIFVPMVTALVLLSAIGRVYRALCVNHRYRFTTWRWGKVVAAMLFIGLVLKLMIGGA